MNNRQNNSKSSKFRFPMFMLFGMLVFGIIATASYTGTITGSTMFFTNLFGENLEVSGTATIPNQVYVSSEGTVLYQPLSVDTINLATNTTLDQNLYDTNNGAMVGFDRNDGTVSGGVTIEDGAMVFDGVNGIITMSSGGLDLFSTSDFSIAGWVYPNDNGVIISNSFNSGSNRMGIGIQSDSFRFHNRINGNSFVVSGNAIFNEFAFFVATFDSSSNKSSLFLNNIEFTGSSALTLSGTDNFRIGSNPDGSTNFNGSATNFFIYDRILNSYEQTQIYNAGRDSYSPVSDGLIAQYSGKDFEGPASAPTKIYDTNMIVQGERTGTSAMKFDGSSGYVSMGDVRLINETFSLSIWLNPSIITSTQTLLGKFSATAGEREFQIDMASQALRLTISDDGNFNSANQKNSGNVFTSTNVWYNAVVTFDKGTVNFYIDGVKIGATQTTTATYLYEGAAKLGIGASISSTNISSGLFKGSISNVLIYDRALSEQEIQALYLKEAPYFTDNNPAGRLGDYAIRGDVSIIGDLDVNGFVINENLTSSLNNKANDNEVVKLSGNQNITGKKTFQDTTIIPNQVYVSSEGTKLYQPLSGDTINLATNTTLDQNLYDTNNGAMVGFTRNDGNVSGGVTIVDGAMKFDGVDGTNIDIGLTGDYSSFTYSVWLKRNNNSNFPHIMSDDSNNYFFWRTGFDYYRIEGPDVDNIILGGGTPLNTWHNIIITGDGSTVKYYVNGVLNATIAQTMNYPLFSNIGSRIGTQYVWNGSISDVVIFNRALSSTEIESIYNAGRDAYSPISDGLVAQYSGRDFEGPASAPTKIYDTNMIVQGERAGTSAMKFDGSNYVYPLTLVRSDESFTISTWLKLPDYDSNRWILNSYTGTHSSLGITTRTSQGILRFSIDGTSLELSNIYSPNEWVYFTMTYDSNVNTFYVYKNGVYQDQRTFTPINGRTEPLVLGGFNNAGSVAPQFNGSISNVLIKDYAMTEEEIQALYLKEAPYFTDNNPAGRLGDYAIRGDLLVNGNRVPTITVSETAPTDPQVGDLWVAIS